MLDLPAARRKLIDGIVARAKKRKRVSTKHHAEFIETYFRGVDQQDLEQATAAYFAEATLNHLQFAKKRKPGQSLVRVYTPDKHLDRNIQPTVIEIVTDDMPFLVDSVANACARYGLTISLTIHPIFWSQRHTTGNLKSVFAGKPTRTPTKSNAMTSTLESWQRIEVDHLDDEHQRQALQQSLINVLDDVRLACADWEPMRQRALQIAAEQERNESSSTSDVSAQECAELIKWLADDHFVFLGYRELSLSRGKNSDQLTPIRHSSLGILRTSRRKEKPLQLSAALRKHARSSERIFMSKGNARSTVHRDTYLDYIGVKRFDQHNRVIGEHRFLGLFTSNVYRLSPNDIPLLRQKSAQLIERLGIAPASHDGKAAIHVLETYPRDELFQVTLDDLADTIRGIVNLAERQRVRLFIHKERFQRYFSCLVYVPRDRYNTAIRQRIEALLRERLQGSEVESHIQLSESSLVRLHVQVRSRAGELPKVAAAELEQSIATIVRSWSDRLRDSLIKRHGHVRGLPLSQQFASAFATSYQDDTAMDDVLRDIDQLVPLIKTGDGVALRLQPRIDRPWLLRLMHAGVPVALSDVLPVLENMGMAVFTEQPYKVVCAAKRTAWVQVFELRVDEKAQPTHSNASNVGSRFNEAFLAVDRQLAENDGFNRLVIAAGLAWREVSMLRAYSRYLLQTGLPFSQSYMERALLAQRDIAQNLCALFHARFDPDLSSAQRKTKSTLIQKEIEHCLDRVQAQDEDRILRAYLAAITATLRTNYFQLDTDGHAKHHLSFKLDSKRITHLPLPKPHVEVFVYSPRVEGIHLRMGAVARGGLRWSDRREDFRTEVLGLMKAQNVKNAVIVPVGAKGGFVVKRLPNNCTADERQREGVACYQTFIRALLDLTDNSINGKIIAPSRVVRYDNDDPYLVVAADKGTATFSDIANVISAEYQFWLGDAFASGGSAGYDHKKMAITARGAWECVKRHFRELSIDTQTQDFTVVGIGDMAGDVFGNGMLRSEHIRLLAAFNHQHIFLDPNPDSIASFVERQRLFALPRSNWEDYNAKKISGGGGIFARSLKSIPLSPQVQHMLGITDKSLPPQSLIKAILRMQVDLFWNGGIGTYVKATSESHSDAGDRTNDALRINGNELRCKVVGEGGNLGFTQLGRIEYAKTGGLINTDFIDNSAGVDCSDHEVNIKISLNSARGLQRARRDKQLVAMTDDIAALVIRDNYMQSQALSVAMLSAVQRLPEHAYFIRTLESARLLDREVEYLPSIETLNDRQKQGQGLTRPELAVLLSYSKITLLNQLLVTNIPEDPYLSLELERYFPSALVESYRPLIRRHRLRREIVATTVTNSLVNRMGPSFALRVQEDTGADAGTVARAYSIAREAFDMRETWSAIESLDNKVAATLQYRMLDESTRLLRFTTYWLINRYAKDLDIEQHVAALRPGIRALRNKLPQLLTGDARQQLDERRARFSSDGIPNSLVTQLASLEALNAAPDIVEIAAATKKSASEKSVAAVAEVYFAIDQLLSLAWLRSQVLALAVQDRWQAIARNTLREQLYDLQRQLCTQVLRNSQGTSESALERWRKKHANSVARTIDLLQAVRASNHVDFATLSVAIQAVKRLL